jgi:hypothetical protein
LVALGQFGRREVFFKIRRRHGDSRSGERRGCVDVYRQVTKVRQKDQTAVGKNSPLSELRSSILIGSSTTITNYKLQTTECTAWAHSNLFSEKLLKNHPKNMTAFRCVPTPSLDESIGKLYPAALYASFPSCRLLAWTDVHVKGPPEGSGSGSGLMQL